MPWDAYEWSGELDGGVASGGIGGLEDAVVRANE